MARGARARGPPGLHNGLADARADARAGGARTGGAALAAHGEEQHVCLAEGRGPARAGVGEQRGEEAVREGPVGGADGDEGDVEAAAGA
jgi:hypothetical protein